MDETALHGREPLILVVDDDPGTRLLATASLRKAGYATVEAADGREGIAAWERFRPDLVLMDALMPGIDGFAAIDEIRRLPGGDRTPFLMMTGLEDLSSIHRAYEAGATDFATKPVNWVVLAHRVGYLLRSHRAFLDLASSEEKTRALLRAIPDLIFRIGADGKVLDLVSAPSREGLPPGREWTGRALRDVLPPAAADDALRKAGEAHLSGEVHRFEYAIGEGAEASSFEARVVSIADGESLFIARDMTESKKAEARLAYLAYHDPLTGLPNRVTAVDRLGRDLAMAKRRHEVVAVVLADLDRFKEVNDTLGHAAGDRLLGAIAARLRDVVRETDTVARISGDEFCVLLPNQHDEHAAVEAARRIQDAFEAPFPLGGGESRVTASLGVSIFPFNGDSAEALLKHADIAMLRAKAQGRGLLELFSEEMGVAVAERVRMERGLIRAEARNEFVVYYQPEVDLRSGLIVGAEALVRWQDPERGLVPPMAFIPLAEESGAIVPMSEWIIRTACAQAKSWHAQGFAPFRLSVNVSARLFGKYDLAGAILRILGETGLDPGSLELEITESVAMSNTESTLETLWNLHGFAIRVAMDDFGTGYSSLAYLKRFPIHLLKIDRAFIKDLDRNPEDRTIVKAILAMAGALNIETIAEGVEREEQLEILKGAGCGLAQGFLLGRPMPAADFADLLERNRNRRRTE
jgi:diguanylate cyclase (GGDEF)-like protein